MTSRHGKTGARHAARQNMPAGHGQFTVRADQLASPREQGDASAITAKVREHVAAGADHVIAGLPIGTDFSVGVDHLERLAPALAEVR
jgi:hypothetical protein